MKFTSKFLFAVFFLTVSPLYAEVVVSDIPAISTEHFGIYDNNSELSLGEDLWENSKLNKNTFATNPYAYYLTAKSYELIRRVLLTSAQAPYAFENDADFARSKMNLLYSLGLHSELFEMMSKYSSKHKLPAEYRRMRIESSLLSLYYKRACAYGENEDSSEIYFHHLRVFCQIYRKQTTAAALSLQVMREQNIKGEFFYELANADIEGFTPIDAEKSVYIEPVYFGLYYLNKNTFNPPVNKKDKIWRLSAIFNHKNASFKSRIEAGEILLQNGLISAESFKKVFTLAAKSKDMPSAVADYQKINATAKADKKASLISKVLADARKNKTFIAYAGLYAPIIKNITPEASVIAYANEMIPALLYAGYYTEASAWEKIAERESEVNPTAKKAAHIFAPAVKILTGNSYFGSSSKALKRFYEEKKLSVGAEKAKKALHIILAVYDAYGIAYDSKNFIANNHLLPAKVSELTGITKEAVLAINEDRNGDAIIMGLQALNTNDTAIITPFLKFLRNNGMKAEFDNIATSLLLTNI